MLDQQPALLQARQPPYEWSLLHIAASEGHRELVELLLGRGLDANVRERGDNTVPMHWAAAGGHLEVVRRLADAGGDVIGEGDDHGLGIIGWASCWGNRHRHVADFLVSRGARHTIFSAVALNMADEVRRIVAADPAALHQRLTRNDGHRTPLHLAVLNGHAGMVDALLELGADPLVTDDSGMPACMNANTPRADLGIMRRIRSMLEAELESARRGSRSPQLRLVDMMAVLALGDWTLAEKVYDPAIAELKGSLHVMAKRGDLAAVTWLLQHGAGPNELWGHWDALVTPLHLAAAQGHVDVVRALLAAGGDPAIRDSKHDGDAAGWAEYGSQPQAPNWRDVVEELQRQL